MEKEMEVIQGLYNMIAEVLVKYSFQILGAIIILFVGIKVAGWLARVTVNICEKYSLDVTLTKFAGNIVRILVLVFVVIITIGKFGISIAPLIAAISALAFGASFAIQGPLSNYGAGLSLILTRPFIVGNTITVNDVSGVVEEIKLAATVLTTEDGEEITIPNKHIVGEVLQNSFANKIIESSVGISYSDDPETAIRIVGQVLEGNAEVCQDPSPQIGIEEFADSSINIGMRYWVPTKKYYQIMYQVNSSLHKELLVGGINMPFPQREVRVLNSDGLDKTV